MSVVVVSSDVEDVVSPDAVSPEVEDVVSLEAEESPDEVVSVPLS